MKAADKTRHLPGMRVVEVEAAGAVLERLPQVRQSSAEHDVSSVYEQHSDFVGMTLQRFGVRSRDLPDMVQEVFVVVHRKLDTFDGSSQMTTWLYGICLRVALAYRRRAHVRREAPVDVVPEPARRAETANPEQVASARQARRELESILDTLDIEKRAVFVMFEIDELSCEQIGAIVGVPVGTVYSRLSAARAAFRKELERRRAREERR
jgi:RNA polymerase sigma-70 factor (ECF subfamily)